MTFCHFEFEFEANAIWGLKVTLSIVNCEYGGVVAVTRDLLHGPANSRIILTSTITRIVLLGGRK